MKKTTALFLCVLLCLAALACGQRVEITQEAPLPTATTDNVVNGYHPVADYPTLLAEQPDIMLNDAPFGSTDVEYGWYEGNTVISEIKFTYEGHPYILRAAYCESEDKMENISTTSDEAIAAMTVEKESIISMGGEYYLAYSTGPDNTAAAAYWYNPYVVCQYILTSDEGCVEGDPIEDVVDLVYLITTDAQGNPIDYESESEAIYLGETGAVTGTILEVNDNDFVANLDSGSTVTFLRTVLDYLDATPGDSVLIAYAGDITEAPLALSVIVMEQKEPEALTMTGVVFQSDATSVYITNDNSCVYGFVLTENTVYTGVAVSAIPGNSVIITYEGDLTNLPKALKVNTISGTSKPVATPDPEPEDIRDKDLRGEVINLSSKRVTICATNGHTYTFKKDKTTDVGGKYTLTNGCTIKVVYDGYASQSPLAKRITVLAPADPTPVRPTPTPKPPRDLIEVRGEVVSLFGNALTVRDENGKAYYFLLGSVDISGTSKGKAGDIIDLWYYQENGVDVVTKIIYTDPEPEHDEYVSRSVIGGTVDSISPYSAIVDGMIFNFVNAKVSGINPYVGCKADVYYLECVKGQCIGEFNVQSIHFWEEAPRKTPEPVTEPEPEPEPEPVEGEN